MMDRKSLFAVVFALAVLFCAGSAFAQTPLPGSAIPQWVNQLPTLALGGGTMENVVLPHEGPPPDYLTPLYMRPFLADILPSTTPTANAYTGTKVFGYRLNRNTETADTYIGPVFVTQRGTSTGVAYVNNLGATSDSATPPFWPASLDQTLHWANPNNLPMYIAQGAAAPYTVGPNPDRQQNYSGPIPAVPHLHGGEVPAAIDGGPDAWYLSDGAAHGPGYYTSMIPGERSAPNAAIYRYPNVMEAAPTWFHDHLLGGTRLNVYAGLAGAYLLIDTALNLPAGMNAVGLNNGMIDLSESIPNGANTELIVPLVIQDRMFDTNGELFFPHMGINPEHPFWIPEFVGDAIVVNGKAWPNLNVEAKRYRFLFINGSNARAYEMFIVNPVTKVMGPAMWQIGTDGGYLDEAVKIDPNVKPLDKLVMMPGERADVIIDFGGFEGQTLILRNTGRTPYPKGTPPQGSTLGRIVQFTVGPVTSFTEADPSYNPATTPAIRSGGQMIQRLVNPATGTLNPAVTVTKNRQLTLNEVMGPGGPLEVLVNNTKWSGLRQTTATIPTTNPMSAFMSIPGSMPDGIGNYLTELPREGTTEVWEIINLTADAHPIHLHLVQFQLLNRQNFNVNKYMGVYNAAFPAGFDFTIPPNGAQVGPGVFIPSFGPPLNYNDDQRLPGGPVPVIGGNPNVTPFLQGRVMPPLPNEAGWKDTVIMYPGQVTRIAVRFAPQDVEPDVTDAVFAFTPNPPNPNASGGGIYNNYDFVWHCHIVDHEDNEMMRPYQVYPQARESAREYKIRVDY